MRHFIRGPQLWSSEAHMAKILTTSPMPTSQASTLCLGALSKLGGKHVSSPGTVQGQSHCRGFDRSATHKPWYIRRLRVTSSSDTRPSVEEMPYSSTGSNAYTTMRAKKKAAGMKRRDQKSISSANSSRTLSILPKQTCTAMTV
eukprot:scaffold93080_cov61-Phaeocystis_antarctica.AAC.4